MQQSVISCQIPRTYFKKANDQKLAELCKAVELAKRLDLGPLKITVNGGSVTAMIDQKWPLESIAKYLSVVVPRDSSLCDFFDVFTRRQLENKPRIKTMMGALCRTHPMSSVHLELSRKIGGWKEESRAAFEEGDFVINPPGFLQFECGMPSEEQLAVVTTMKELYALDTPGFFIPFDMAALACEYLLPGARGFFLKYRDKERDQLEVGVPANIVEQPPVAVHAIPVEELELEESDELVIPPLEEPEPEEVVWVSSRGQKRARKVIELDD